MRMNNTAVLVWLLMAPSCAVAVPEAAANTNQAFHGALLAAEAVTEARLSQLKSAGIDAVTLPIHDSPALRAAEQVASQRIQAASLALYYWVEVARCPELADAHP